MWDLMVAAAQAPALQWVVVFGALAGFVWKVVQSTDGQMMNDLYPDELDHIN